MYADGLRERFPDLEPVVDDLLLLEPHQIAGLPERAPRNELALILRAHPHLARFFVARHPPIASFIADLTDSEPSGEDDLEGAEARVLWELADFIVYQREPAMYDAAISYSWGVDALMEAQPLEGSVVVDAGAGTGYATFAVAGSARLVYAVEPVAALRRFVADKAKALGLANVYTVDGFLHSIPLPSAAADVLVGQRAIGWDLDVELGEIERVVKPGGVAIQLTGMPLAAGGPPSFHDQLVARGYRESSYLDGGAPHRKYYKHI